MESNGSIHATQRTRTHPYHFFTSIGSCKMLNEEANIWNSRIIHDELLFYQSQSGEYVVHAAAFQYNKMNKNNILNGVIKTRTYFLAGEFRSACFDTLIRNMSYAHEMLLSLLAARCVEMQNAAAAARKKTPPSVSCITQQKKKRKKN